MGILEVMDKLAETAGGNTGCPGWAKRQLAQEFQQAREWIEQKAIPAVEAEEAAGRADSQTAAGPGGETEDW